MKENHKKNIDFIQTCVDLVDFFSPKSKIFKNEKLLKILNHEKETTPKQNTQNGKRKLSNNMSLNDRRSKSSEENSFLDGPTTSANVSETSMLKKRKRNGVNGELDQNNINLNAR